MVDSTPNPKALLDGTTPGPWEWDGGELFTAPASSDDALGIATRVDRVTSRDAALIAAAPDLAARLVEAEALLREAQDRFANDDPNTDGLLASIEAFLPPSVDGEQPHE